MTQLEKPLTPQEALAHYGTKGMKWGVTRSKPTSAEIHDARARLGSKQRQLNAQIDKMNLASGTKLKAEEKKLSEMSTKFLKDPDRATALRLTRGEAAILAVLAVGVPIVGTTAAGIAAGSQIAARKAVERQQRKLS